MDEEGNYIERKFGYSKVCWNIENYCVTPSGPDWMFYSPEFKSRGFYTTKWRMHLKRIFVNEKEYNVLFQLQRLDCGSCEEVSVDCFVEYSDHAGETIEMDFQSNFLVNAICERELRNTGFVPVKSYHSNSFLLKCEILVTFPGAVEVIPSTDDIAVRKLSEDLLQLIVTGDLYDFQVSVDNAYIPAHKAILYYRIPDPVFRNKITQAGDLLMVDDFSRQGADKVLKFLYTGNLELAVNNPVISAYKFAELLDVKPIMDYYEPDEHCISTNINVEEFIATWIIKDFTSRTEYYIRSPRMTSDNKTFHFYLKIHPKGFGSKETTVAFFMEIATVEPTDACIEFFIENNQRRRVSQQHHKRIVSKEIFGDKCFINRNELNNYLQTGDLTVGVRLRMPTGIENLSLGNSKVRFEQVSVKACYERYATDLLRMHEDQAYQDFRVRFSNHIAYLHKCVLSVRYPSLYIALEQNLPYFSELKYKVLKSMFIFLYTGGIEKNLNLEDTFTLYEVADEFDVTTLKLIIVNKLQSGISETNVRRICEFAEIKNIANLLNVAQLYIQEHCN